VKRKITDGFQHFRKRWSRRRSAAALPAERRPPDVTDPRAKSRRHGKVAADKWNQ
jgi:hypothetical protein